MSNDEIQPVSETSTSKEIDDWVLEIKARPNISNATRPLMYGNIEKWPSIFGKWQCWDDFGASFLTETQKWIIVACMTHCYGLNVRSYLEYMQGKIDLAWSYYRGVDELFPTPENNKRFIQHLLVNSCLIIIWAILVPLVENDLKKIWFETIYKKSYLAEGLTDEDLQSITDYILNNKTVVASYMLTMNYQIPWFVVEVVYTEHSNLSKIFVTPILKIAGSRLKKFYPKEHLSKEDGGSVPEGGFKHLLHVFHWSRTPDGKYQVDRESRKPFNRFHIPSATELQLSQTVFVKDEDDSIDVSYSDNGRFSGVMHLPSCQLLQHIIKRYESLLRFEHQLSCGKAFSAYFTCISCLLKTEEDVKLLREKGVIPNTTLEDKDVLRCVQDLKSLIKQNLLMPNELIILEKKVMAHYQKSASKVYGDFKKRYCSNPWITISVIAGILLFVLTFLQTLYGMLSYYNQ